MRTSHIAGVLFFFLVVPLCTVGCPDRAGSRPDAGNADAAAIVAWLADAESRLPVPPPIGLVDAGPDGAAVKMALSNQECLDFDRFQAKMADGRKATGEKRYADAESSFTRAIGVRPTDARAHAERGYARLLSDDLPGADQDFTRALASGVDAKLGAQVYFNVGLLREKEHRADAARSAFAISNLLAPSAAAKAKLGTGSPCTAEIDDNANTGDPLTEVAGWDELSAAIAPDKDLGDPKKSACIRTHSATAEPEERDVCAGEPPWVLTHHHQWLTEQATFVVPKKAAKSLLYWQARVGLWPAQCVNLPVPKPTVEGDLLRVSVTFDGRQASVAENAPLVDNFMTCVDTLAYKEDVFYDLRNGKQVLSVYVPGGVPGPSIVASAGPGGPTIRLTGAGCDRTIKVAAP